MATTTKSLAERRAAWIEANPLRQWRTETHTSILRAAAAIGCTTSTVQKWEYGASTLTDRFRPRVAALLGVSGEDLSEQWALWERREPKAA